MKKLALAGIVVAGALALTGCSSDSPIYDYTNQSANDGGDWDWDLGHMSSYNNKTYCKGGTYKPVSSGYTCTNNGIVSSVTPRPSAPIKPKTPPPAPKQNTAPKQNSAPKQNTAPKPAAPRPAAPRPAPKSGK